VAFGERAGDLHTDLIAATRVAAACGGSFGIAVTTATTAVAAVTVAAVTISATGARTSGETSNGSGTDQLHEPPSERSSLCTVAVGMVTFVRQCDSHLPERITP
jgi:hypothetical protein